MRKVLYASRLLYLIVLTALLKCQLSYKYTNSFTWASSIENNEEENENDCDVWNHKAVVLQMK